MAYVYLNGPTLASSTAVYQDSALSIYAPDGYYSNGTIVRQWTAGVLLPPQTCPSCASPCGGAINGSGNQGVYTLSIDLGTATGATIITFDPFSVPDGIIVVFNGVLYNELSSFYYGYVAGTPNLPTYVGRISSDCGLVAGSPHTVNVYNYNAAIPDFEPTGGTQTVSVLSGQMALTATDPGNCIMVIPKLTASPSIMNITCFGLCSSTVFNIAISCPAPLSGITISNTLSVPCGCDEEVSQPAYIAISAAQIGFPSSYLNAWVFTDENGVNPLPQGYYTIVISGTIYCLQVDSHGIIIDINVCGS
jgi:hypothetical protein